MSYSATLYLISLDKLASVLNRGDSALAEMLRALPSESAQDTPHPDAARELAFRIAAGGQQDAGINLHQIIFAIEMICNALGTRLPIFELNSTSTSYLRRVSENVPGGRNLLQHRPIPGVVHFKGFPILGHVTLAEAMDALNQWDIAAAERMSPAVAAGCLGLVDALQAAKETGLDLACFTY